MVVLYPQTCSMCLRLLIFFAPRHPRFSNQNPRHPQFSNPDLRPTQITNEQHCHSIKTKTPRNPW